MPSGRGGTVLSKLSDYEIARLKRIREIQDAMNTFKVKEVAEALTSEKRAWDKVKRKRREIERTRRRATTGQPVETVRRVSGRKRNRPAHFDPGALDKLLRKRKSWSSTTPRRKFVIPELTDEQRRRLDDAKDWLDEFEDFLTRVPHGRNGKVISEQNCRSVMRQVRILVSGQGVTYKHWNDGTVCFKGRPVTLGTDFVELFEEAKAFENEHGKDKGNGWLMLHPITKLLCFQIYKVSITPDDSTNEDETESESGGEDNCREATDRRSPPPKAKRKEERATSRRRAKRTRRDRTSVPDADAHHVDWLRYITTEDNETLLSISNMDGAPSLAKLLRNNQSTFPGIKARTRLKVGTSVWIRPAVHSSEEELPTSSSDEDDHRYTPTKRGAVPKVTTRRRQRRSRRKYPLVGRNIRKTFKGFGEFVGRVVSYDTELKVYCVQYEDGDSEEMSVSELSDLLLPESDEV